MTEHEKTLRMLVLTPHIRAYLTKTDPKALDQALKALGFDTRRMCGICGHPDENHIECIDFTSATGCSYGMEESDELCRCKPRFKDETPLQYEERFAAFFNPQAHPLPVDMMKNLAEQARKQGFGGVAALFDIEVAKKGEQK